MFQSTNEHTTSSPSGIHVGNYIVCAQRINLREVIYKHMSAPFRYGFELKRWCQEIHVMIPKNKDQPIIGRLRNIQLIETDLNAYLKI